MNQSDAVRSTPEKFGVQSTSKVKTESFFIAVHILKDRETNIQQLDSIEKMVCERESS